MLEEDHDKIILLSTPFPTIPILGTNYCNVILFCVGNKLFIVLYITHMPVSLISLLDCCRPAVGASNLAQSKRTAASTLAQFKRPPAAAAGSSSALSARKPRLLNAPTPRSFLGGGAGTFFGWLKQFPHPAINRYLLHHFCKFRGTLINTLN